jgi:hypothetical protein
MIEQPFEGNKYKRYVTKFGEESPQEWIEIWAQNSVSGGSDQASNMKTLVRGESGAALETALQDTRKNEDGNIVAITAEHVISFGEWLGQLSHIGPL